MLPSGPYDPHKTEKKWSEIWEKKKYFQAEPKNSKKPYCILMPPPNVTGGLHMGHAMQHTIMDILARTKRMQGFDVLLQPGVDHAGILFQGTLVKRKKSHPPAARTGKIFGRMLEIQRRDL
jgi:valyl-tRNA synthetase